MASAAQGHYTLFVRLAGQLVERSFHQPLRDAVGGMRHQQHRAMMGGMRQQVGVSRLLGGTLHPVQRLARQGQPAVAIDNLRNIAEPERQKLKRPFPLLITCGLIGGAVDLPKQHMHARDRFTRPVRTAPFPYGLNFGSQLIERRRLKSFNVVAFR
ncbi:hypothetical protein ACFQ0O_30930 [Saccharopolyspora spinosporotrichia]